ncbi:MAG TPA: hypothetical protein VID47_01895 [Actinomycetota bacterium]|jgi:hypothetical protein
MDAPFHAHPHTTRLIPPVRTLAVLTFGIGIGVVATLPLGRSTAIAAVVAIVAATAAAAFALLRPRNPAAVVAADVLLGLAVIATVFGRLGLLYLPLLLAFLAVTARMERAPERSDAGLHWEPAPEFEEAMPPSIAAPATIEDPAAAVVGEPGIIEEPGVPADDGPSSEGSVVIHVAGPPDGPPDAATDVVQLDDVDLGPMVEPGPEDVDPDPEDGDPSETSRSTGRHRAPSPVRRVAAAAARAGRRLGDQARTGAGNIRSAITTEPTGIEPPDPASDPPEAPDPGAPPRHESVRRERSAELDALRHEFEERELELVASGRPWSSLTHRAYGELRYLSPPPSPPRRPPGRRHDPIEIDGSVWESPTWKALGDD